jgi:hypothetical protein
MHVDDDTLPEAVDDAQRLISCSPQSQRSDWNTSPVRHCECTRTSGTSFGLRRP